MTRCSRFRSAVPLTRRGEKPASINRAVPAPRHDRVPVLGVLPPSIVPARLARDRAGMTEAQPRLR